MKTQIFSKILFSKKKKFININEKNKFKTLTNPTNA